MTNIILKKLTMRNFLSIGNNTQVIDLSKDQLTLVLGDNNDTGGRNGTGKTSICQAISYGLFGKPLTKVRLQNLCNNVNKKNMVVTIEFERDGVSYRIERGQKPAYMRLFINSDEQKEDDESQGENRKTQERIDALLGMSHSLFRHIIALNTFTEPFLRMTVGDQRSVIEELFGVTQISDRAETLKGLIAVTKDRMREQEAVIRTTVETNERITKTISNTKRQFEAWDKTKVANLIALEEQIVALETINFDDEIAIFEKLDIAIANERTLTYALDVATRELAHAKQDHLDHTRRYDELRRDKTSAAGRVASLSLDLGRKEKTLLRHENNISTLGAAMDAVLYEQSNADSSDCVCCGQTLSGTDHLATVIANIVLRVQSAEKELDREIREHSTVLVEITDLKAAISSAILDDENEKAHKATEMAAHADEIEKLSIVISEKKSAVDAIRVDLKDIGPLPKTAFANRDELYSAKQVGEILVRDLETERAKTNPYGEQIDALQSTMTEVSYEELNDLDNLFKHQDFLLKLLVSKDSFIRKHIVDQNIQFMNGRLEHYLTKLGLPHSVKFLSDLSVDITLLGIDMDFEQLSRGEMNRVILSTSWAFRDAWESLNFSINLMFLDELIDNGLCHIGVDGAVSVLKDFARNNKNVFLISHRDELVSSFENILKVIKTDGFTVFE